MSQALRAEAGFSLVCTPSERALLVFAHADDETIALGARLSRLNITRLVHVTDGAPRDEHDRQEHGFRTLDDYRAARAGEFQDMLAAAGIPTTRWENLRIPDQEAALNLVALTRRIAAILAADSPDLVFTHPYEGGHPDHDACAFAVHRAVQIAPGPRIVECAFYHAGPGGIEAGSFLPQPAAGEPLLCELSPEEQSLKRRLIQCFRSQRETLQYFPIERESFRGAPAYDFSQPAHPGQLFYERFPWGMTGQRFCELAMQAHNALITEPALTVCP